MNTVRVIHGVADHLMVRLPEWANAITLFLFGLTLLQPGQTFASPSYAVMQKVASENTWGWAFAVLGGVRLAALIVDGTSSELTSLMLRVRALSATFCCFAWMGLSAGLYLANPLSPGSKTYAALLVVDMVIAIYLGRRADRDRKGSWTTQL